MDLDNEVHVRCRGLGHQWDDFTPIDMRPPQFGVRLSFRCVRCGTERHDVIQSHSNGDLLHRQYRHYPMGYSVDRQAGEHRPTAADLRVNLHRMRRKEPLRAKRSKKAS